MMPSPGRHVASLSIMLVMTSVSVAEEPFPERVQFNRDIRPVLSQKCFACHGPDSEARKADLRLDIRSEAVADRGGYAAVVPGDSDASEVHARITSADPATRMPPPDSQYQLTPRELKLLTAWITQGATFETHWAFRPIARVQPPAMPGREARGAQESAGGFDSRSQNPIDRFIFDRLRRRELRPSPPADAYTLIKRMYLDLVGLLPEPDTTREFAAAYESDPDAAVRVLARKLLGSRHYGERWGRHWLDQARYADSHGYTIDGERTMWPYRDWVIRALNDDMPFDQFTIEQLAGDLLPNPEKSQLVATGFHRNTLINQEGGTDDEQFRNEEVVDRVNTTGAVWLGLTLGCAQCHSHKFDPLSQQEYYQLFAFFNHTADINDVGPTVSVREGELFLRDADPALLAEWEQARSHLTTTKANRAKRQAAWENALVAEASDHPDAAWMGLIPERFAAAGGAPLQPLDDHSLLAGEGAAKEVYTIRLRLPDRAPREPIAALRLRVLPDDSLPRKGPGRASNGNFLLSEVEIRIDGAAIPVARAEADHAQPGFPITNAVDGDPATGWAINVGKSSPPGAKMNAPHEAHFVFDKPVAPAQMRLTVVLRQEVSDNYNLGRFAFDASTKAPPAVLSAQLLAAVKTESGKRTDEQQKLLMEEFAKADREGRAAETRVAAARKKLGLGAAAETMVMREREQPRETFLHIRGDFLRKDRQTGPLRADVPAILPPLGEASLGEASARGERPARRTRLELARWLVADHHPLTARVTVNRIWMRYFGRGLVATENDFGTQGALPTHPELLDWLARSFIESGWSMKKLHQLIVTSAVYRQASHARKDLDNVDPLNTLLGRQNRIRVDAEIVRDLALSASSLLNPKIGGPSVRPPQPAGVYAFTQRKIRWTPEKGEDRFRRAMYTQFYRSAPYPMLTTFDAPDFQTVCTRRPRSNTPLQSLTMANDPALLEMMRGLASRLLTDVGGTDERANRHRIERAFLLCFARLPDAEEAEAISQFRRRQQELFKANPASAAAVAPAHPPDAYSAEFAASWTAVARALMNTDEFITRE